MIEIYENTVYTKSIIFKFSKDFFFIIGINTIKWLIMFFKKKYKFFSYKKTIKDRKIRSKGKYIQGIRKVIRIFCLNLSWTIFHEYSKRKVYIYYHKKKYLNQKPFLDRLKTELKQVLKK